MIELLPYILSAASLLLSIFLYRKDYRFGKPDALAKYEALVNELIVKNEKLTTRVECLETELESYRLGVLILISQLQEMGVQPKWKPGKKRDTGELKSK